MNLGISPIDTFKLGDLQADKIMLGAEEVWVDFVFEDEFFASSTTWIAPFTGQILAVCVGGGGSGGACCNTYGNNYSVNGGGAATPTETVIDVVEGVEYAITVGSGGAGAYAPSGTHAEIGGPSGGTSSVDALATGGGGGGGGVSQSGGDSAGNGASFTYEEYTGTGGAGSLSSGSANAGPGSGYSAGGGGANTRNGDSNYARAGSGSAGFVLLKGI